MGVLSIDRELCLRDGACADSCPYSLIKRDADGVPFEIAGAEAACIRCGHCVAVCRSGALTHSQMDRATFVDLDRLDRSDTLAFALRARRSIRAFRPEPLPKAEMAALFELVRYAPTANNSQKLWWIVTTGPEQTAELAGLAAQWMHKTFYPGRIKPPWREGEDPALRGAPHVALCCAPADYSWGATDAAIAATYLELLAFSRGLGTCWAGVFMRAARESPELAAALALPEGRTIYAALMLGRPRHPFKSIPPRNPPAIDWR
jgi:nitroreductase/NAD-dependent dihydropyrimidine dehydrogenase PreA subunit